MDEIEVYPNGNIHIYSRTVMPVKGIHCDVLITDDGVEIKNGRIKMVEQEEKFHLFWGGIFSQWHLARIYDIDLDMIFNCNEQYMMYNKAILFGDEDTAENIMAEPDPRKQKAWGRRVKDFDKEKWEEIARDIVSKANYMKFSQNRKLLIDLMAFDDDTVFVEASPFDPIWGIGLGEDDPDALDRSKWLGTNWLGECINIARDRIVENQKWFG